VNDVSELTITALRFGFLLLLWVLIFSIVSTMRRDFQIGRKAVTGVPTAREVRKHPELADTAEVGLVPSGDEFAFDISTLQPAQDSDWTDYFASSAPRTAAP